MRRATSGGRSMQLGRVDEQMEQLSFVEGGGLHLKSVPRVLEREELFAITRTVFYLFEASDQHPTPL